MEVPRRKFLQLTGGAAALPAVSRVAWAQSYPTRPVRMIVGFPSGTAPDITGRLMSQWLSERLRQQFIVDNRPGSASSLAVELVATAPADGYTLLLALSSNAVNAALYSNLNFNIVRDIAPVAYIGGTPFVLVVTPSFPAKTLAEFVAYASANPHKVNMASQGVGTTPHACGELLRMMTGIGFTHVPYRSSLMPDLLAGQVHFYFSPMPQPIEYVRDGRLRALGVTTATRLSVLPDVPTIAEVVPGYEAIGWTGVGAPKSTASEIVDKLNTEINAIINDPKKNAQLVNLGLVPQPMAPAAFGKFIAGETEKWAKVINFAGIEVE